MEARGMKHMFKRIFLTFSVLVSVRPLTANDEYINHSYNDVGNDSCVEAPLTCGSFDIAVHGGIAPIIWNDVKKTRNIEIDPVRILKLIDVPKFDTIYHLPWTVGGQLGYAFTDFLRFYFELNYLQADPKSTTDTRFFSLSEQLPLGSTVNFGFERFRLYEIYFGTQLYSHRWLDRVSFFAGTKIGLTRHYRINFTLGSFIPGNPPALFINKTNRVPFFLSSMSVSAGINAGFDVDLGHNLSLVFMGEIVASQGPETNSPIVVGTGDVNQLIMLPTTFRTEVRFPITVGLRYSF